MLIFTLLSTTHRIVHTSYISATVCIAETSTQYICLRNFVFNCTGTCIPFTQRRVDQLRRTLWSLAYMFDIAGAKLSLIFLYDSSRSMFVLQCILPSALDCSKVVRLRFTYSTSISIPVALISWTSTIYFLSPYRFALANYNTTEHWTFVYDEHASDRCVLWAIWWSLVWI